MSHSWQNILISAGLGTLLHGQMPSLPPGVNPSTIKQMLKQQGGAGLDAKKAQFLKGRRDPKAVTASVENAGIAGEQPPAENPLEKQLEELKAREGGPRRFGEDLFRFRDRSPMSTEGGIAEDYVLGAGDSIALLLTGGKEEELESTVDGKGEISVPEVGTVKVSGLSLAEARRRIQTVVRRAFATTRVDFKLTKLREVRVFVLGEVYRPGSYLVPSLSSMVNVLSMAGGPSALGSFRRIQILRGGKEINSLDLYALRAEGRGNFNLSFQNGDTLFVPLAATQVLLEGAFTRVSGQIPDRIAQEEAGQDRSTRKLKQLEREVRLLERRLGQEVTEAIEGKSGDEGFTEATAAQPISLALRAELEGRLESLENQLEVMRANARGDQRVAPGESARRTLASIRLDPNVPAWIERWQSEGLGPVMQFELLPEESALDAVQFAGGLLPIAFSGHLSLKRLDLSGVVSVLDVPFKALAQTKLRHGDELSAMPNRDRLEKSVRVKGWVRSVGRFALEEGLRVGDLLKRDGQLLPETYRGRGEIVRTLPDGTTKYLSFDVLKALEGDPMENLALQGRDEIELYRVSDFKVNHTVTVVGPMTRSGEFPFHQGLRAADLLFWAGVPLRSANLYAAELARVKDGVTSQVLPLDLVRLLTTEEKDPGLVRDDGVNPLLQPYDRISVFEKPNFRLHRTVSLTGEVGKPGSYVIDLERQTLKDLIARAGGLTPDSMPKAGIFLRRPQALDPSIQRAGRESGLNTKDPTALGINEIMDRLSETKRHPLSGDIQKSPILHPLAVDHIKRLVIDFERAMKGDPEANVELEDGDEIIIPRKTDSVYVVGETASPFAVYKAKRGMSVSELLDLAGGPTRNADMANLRLLKADGRILDSWVKRRAVEPGDVLLLPQRIPRDYNWQENLQAITPLALILNALKN